MNYQEYLEKINFNSSKQIQILNLDTFVTYEEVFKWKWIATKLKIFSFVAYSEELNAHQIIDYSKECLQYALKNKKGLPIGWQNGIVSNNVIVSKHVMTDAIATVTSRPVKHFAAFEMPVIYDLSKNLLYFYNGEIIWGSIYNTFLKDFILDKFNV